MVTKLVVIRFDEQAWKIGSIVDKNKIKMCLFLWYLPRILTKTI